MSEKEEKETPDEKELLDGGQLQQRSVSVVSKPVTKWQLIRSQWEYGSQGFDSWEWGYTMPGRSTSPSR